MMQTNHKSNARSLRTPELLLCAFLLAVLSSCSLIDEDLSDCGSDYTIDYELRLVTNMTTEIQTQLSAQTNISVAAALRAHLSDIFTDYAHDVDLSFYDTAGDSVRLYHDEHIMDANQHSYTLYFPRQKYMHLAVANIVDDPLISMEEESHCHTSTLVQQHTGISADTIGSHATGLFTARQPMEMKEGIDQTFNVQLYMANCAACIVIDPRGHSTEGMQVFTTGFATSFSIADSVFHFSDKAPIVRTTRIAQQPQDEARQDETNDDLLCFCSVNFPSREPSEDNGQTTRTIIETTEPFIAQNGEESLWEFRVYAPRTNDSSARQEGSITETILRIKEPLRAGGLKVIRCWLNEEGSVETDDNTVGVSVTLDWNKGNVYNPQL